MTDAAPTAPAFAAAPTRSNPVRRKRAPREEWVDALRGIAIVLVVWFHTAVVAGDGTAHHFVVESVNRFGAPFRMPVLMLVSGMMIGYSLRRTTGHFIRGKIETIAWPYLLWSGIDMLVDVALGEPPWAGSIPAILVEFLTPSHFQWYIAYLFLFSVIAGLLPRRLLPWIALVSIVVSTLLSFETYQEAHRFTYLLAFFLIGDLLAQWWRTHPDRMNDARLVTAGWVLALFPLALSLAWQLPTYDTRWAPFILMAIFVLRPLLQTASAAGWSTPLKYVGRNGMTFYMSSYASLLIGHRILVHLWPAATVEQKFVVLFPFALLIGAVFAQLRRTRLGDVLFLAPSAPKSRVQTVHLKA